MIIYNNFTKKKSDISLPSTSSASPTGSPYSLSKENVLFLKTVLGLKVRENGRRNRK